MGSQTKSKTRRPPSKYSSTSAAIRKKPFGDKNQEFGCSNKESGTPSSSTTPGSGGARTIA